MMPKLDLYDVNGKVVGNVTLKDEVFNTEINTVGQVIMIIESSACEKLQVLSNIYG